MNDFQFDKKIKPRIIGIQEDILSAFKQMDRIDKKLLFVFDEENFINILSIGDIQRAIINNKPLGLPVSEILRKNTTLAHEGDSFSTIKALMLEFRTECMPVIDKHRHLIDVYFWEDVFPDLEKQEAITLNLPVIIVAGGKGTRLKPITNILPKPLIPLGDKTILEHIMDKFLKVGCKHFYLSVNYKAEMIQQYFEALNHAEYKIQFFKEEKPLGTAGSLHLLKGKINQTFFVSNCDIIIEEDYREIFRYHQDNQNEITIVAALRHYKIPYGTLESAENGVLTSISEKPELTFKINSGMYILEPGLLDEIPENKFFHITELIDTIIKRKGRVGVFPVSEKSWKDIGEWDEYLKIAR